MKIQRPNQTHLNVYNNQMQKQQQHKQKLNREDRLQISNEAKRLQQDGQIDKKRTAYVESIKNKVATGNYEINLEKTAQKMIDFWSR